MSADDAYRSAGVDVEAADRAVDAMREAVASTYDARVLRGLGAFGGTFQPGDLGRAPVLVASTDGVGTKSRVASRLRRFGGIGRDLVNHCVNDVLVQGAVPLFFLDYVASDALDPSVVAEIVGGVASACREAGMPLLGGETAEMPGVYARGEWDVVGTIVGVVQRDRLIDGSRVREGDAILGFASNGLQTNGYSLARKAFEGDEGVTAPDGRTWGEHLLDEHRSFLPFVLPSMEAGIVRAAAHVTGGGIDGNLPRSLPEGLGAEIRPGWHEPMVIEELRRRGVASEAELRRVFNMGVGFLIVVAEEDVSAVEASTSEPPFRVGTVTRGPGIRWAARA